MNVHVASTTATAVSLSWNASTDNVGVTGYRVSRCTGSACTPSTLVASPTTTSYADSGLSAGTSYSYRVAAVDAAGNVSAQSTVAIGTTSVAPPPSGGGQDFATRCAAAGVLKCVGFDTAASVAPATWPAPGTYPVRQGQATQSPVFDADVKSSGAGALKFILPGRTGSDVAGQWRQDLGMNFGPGSTFYIQFRQRFSSEMLSIRWADFSGSFKQVIFHNFEATCSDVELTTQNNYNNNIPIMYTDCGARGMWTNNGVPPYLLQQGDYNCAYDNEGSSSCFHYSANEWLTFYYKITLGNWGQASSTIQAWVAREGQPFKQWVNMPNFRLNNTTPGKNYDYLTLLPYMTDKNSGVDHVTAYTWYDDLIVSTRPIAPPLGVSAGSAP
jgi:hypothetical protein